MFHRALIINLEVTEVGLFALVLDVLLPQCVMVAAGCAVFCRVPGAHTQPRDRETYPGACPHGPAQGSSAPRGLGK